MSATFDGWTDFNVAMAGASAALAGLIIVSLSVNLERILAAPSVPARARSSLCCLILALAASCLALMPDQRLWLYGLEVAVGVVIVLLTVVSAMRAIYADTQAPGLVRAAKSVALVIAPALFAVGAVILLTGGASGLYWVAAGSVAAIAVGIVLAWVALIEVLR